MRTSGPETTKPGTECGAGSGLCLRRPRRKDIRLKFHRLPTRGITANITVGRMDDRDGGRREREVSGWALRVGFRGDRPDAGRGRRRQGRAPGGAFADRRHPRAGWLLRDDGRLPADHGGSAVDRRSARSAVAPEAGRPGGDPRAQRGDPPDHRSGSPSPTIWRRRSRARSPGSASKPPTPSDPARRRRTCRRPPSRASRTRT